MSPLPPPDAAPAVRHHRVADMLDTLDRHRPEIDAAARSLGLLAQTTHYAVAVLRWISMGRPVRSAEETAQAAALCQACQRLRGDRCGQCGCRVAIEGWPIRSKIRMASEHCPERKW